MSDNKRGHVELPAGNSTCPRSPPRAWAVLALAYPAAAQAQKLNAFFVGLAASPLLLVLLSVYGGVLARSWRFALASLALTGVWAAWFVAASDSASDLMAWAPILAMVAHIVAVLPLAMAWRRRHERR